MNFFDRLLSLNLTWRDAVDILIVACIIYSIFALIRGTRAMQISIGLVILGSTFFVARAFDLPALEAISRQILFYLPFAVIVLFQQEIRRALARMGGGPVLPSGMEASQPVNYAPAGLSGQIGDRARQAVSDRDETAEVRASRSACDLRRRGRDYRDDDGEEHETCGWQTTTSWVHMSP